MQAASVMQLNTGLESRCLVTRGITESIERKTEKVIEKKDMYSLTSQRSFTLSSQHLSTNALLPLTSQMLTD